MSDPIAIDVAVFGGGIAGLWCLNRLRSEGFSALLVERDHLGSGQTLASQGMIHGGRKYARESLRTAIAAMPALWDACLAGHGDVDLRTAVTLSDTQVMWAAPGLAAGLASAIGARAVHGDTQRVTDSSEWPAVFRTGSRTAGRIYRIAERVVDVKSVLDALRAPHAEALIHSVVERIDWDGATIRHVELAGGNRLIAQHYLFTAGLGNEEVAARLGLGGRATQRRPLRQILVRNVPHPLYGHCIGASEQPKFTVTSHPVPEGGFVWYLGGAVAEQNVALGSGAAIELAVREVAGAFPAIDWSGCEWAAYPVDRAEAFADGRLPIGPQLRACGNAVIAWPTKLAFAPALATQVIDHLRVLGVRPRIAQPTTGLDPATIGSYPWELPLEWTRPANG